MSEQRLSDRVLQLVDAHRKLLLAGVLCVYLLGFNAQWRIERDSALYLTIGRNLADGQGYTFRELPHHAAYPGLPLVFAGAYRLLHSDRGVILFSLILMVALGWATLGLTYRLFLLHCGRPTAVLMVVGLGLTRLFYRYNFELLSDLPFLMGAMAFLCGYEALSIAPGRPRHGRPARARPSPQWYDWALLIGGLGVAVAMRPTMWLLLAAIVLAMLWRAARGPVNWAQLAILVGVVALAAIAFCYFDPRRAPNSATDDYEGYVFQKVTHLGPLLHQILHGNIRDLFEATLIKALFGCAMWKGVNTVIGLGILALGAALFRQRVLWGFWVLLTVGSLLLFKPLDRYFLPVVPLLVYAWWRFLVWLNHRLPARVADLAFLAFFFTGLGMNLARVGEMIVEQRRMPFLAHYREGRYASVEEVGRMVRDKVGRRDWVVVDAKVGRVMTFVSHRNCLGTVDGLPRLGANQKLFALTGPPWDEKDPSRPGKAEAMSSTAPVTVPMPVGQWLDTLGLARGPRVGGPVRSKYEKESWALYLAVPKGQGEH